MKEKLQEYALIAEIIGGFAIVISLVFVGFQIQQGTEETAINTAAIRTSAYQDLTAQMLDIYSSVSTSPQLAELFYKANCGQALTPVEEVQMRTYGIQTIRHGDMAYQMYEQGLIDQDQLRNANAILLANLTQTVYFFGIWNGLKISVNPAFVAYIEERVQRITPDGPLPSPWC